MAMPTTPPIVTVTPTSINTTPPIPVVATTSTSVTPTTSAMETPIRVMVMETNL